MPGVAIARVQIAGVHDADEAGLLCSCGVGWIGIPLRLPVHCEDLSDAEAAAVVRHGAGKGSTFVLITYLERAAAIADLARWIGVRHVQVHGEISDGELDALRVGLPGVVIIKSLVVRPGEDTCHLLDRVTRLAPRVDAFITDTFDPSTGASGATGRTHDWAVSREVVRISPRPVILAGGLTPDNVAAAIGAVLPAGVDSHTGVEGADGRKDEALVRRFVAEATRAFAAYPQKRPAGGPSSG
jgi:phosphoribosylanthranilate isomerase